MYLLFHLTTQANYCLQANQESEQRTAFEKEFGFPLQGYREDVEDREENVSRIALAVYRQKLEKDFNLSAIRISSDDYTRKSIVGQLEHILFEGGSAYSGIAPPDLQRLYFNHNSVSYSTVVHELKHTKTEEIHDQHPEFKEKWLAITPDEDGVSAYSSLPLWFISKLRYIGKYVTIGNYDPKENERLGFTSSYGRFWWYEDVAVVSEEAQNNSLGDIKNYIRFLYLEKNEKIIAKVNLLQEYGLIPAEFTEYIGVRKHFKDYEDIQKSEENRCWEKESSLDKVLKASAAFLNSYPETTYGIILRQMRGNFLEKNKRYAEAILEYKSGLHFAFKDHETYANILGSLSDCYNHLDNNEESSLYAQAKERYVAGWKGNDIHIAVHGVNDFLEENGEKF